MSAQTSVNSCVKDVSYVSSFTVYCQETGIPTYRDFKVAVVLGEQPKYV